MSKVEQDDTDLVCRRCGNDFDGFILHIIKYRCLWFLGEKDEYGKSGKQKLEYMREYYKKNKKEIRKRNDKWIHENKERWNGLQRKTMRRRLNVQNPYVK